MRTLRTLPRILEPGEVDALFGALRALRDRAMVEAMATARYAAGSALSVSLSQRGPARTSQYAGHMGAPSHRWDRLLATVVVVVAAFMFLGFISFLSRMVSNPELAQSGLIRLLAVLAFALFAALGVGRRYLRNQHEDTD